MATAQQTSLDEVRLLDLARGIRERTDLMGNIIREITMERAHLHGEVETARAQRDAFRTRAAELEDQLRRRNEEIREEAQR